MNRTVRVLPICGVIALFGALRAAEPMATAEVSVDVGTVLGPVKPMHAVNNGPSVSKPCGDEGEGRRSVPCGCGQGRGRFLVGVCGALCAKQRRYGHRHCCAAHTRHFACQGALPHNRCHPHAYGGAFDPSAGRIGNVFPYAGFFCAGGVGLTNPGASVALLSIPMSSQDEGLTPLRGVLSKSLRLGCSGNS